MRVEIESTNIIKGCCKSPDVLAWIAAVSETNTLDIGTISIID